MLNSKELKLIELSVGVAYSSDPREVISIVSNAISGVDGVDSARSPIVGIQEFADSSINIGARFLATSDSYFETL
jgi:small conductance mechanosensitive channel